MDNPADFVFDIIEAEWLNKVGDRAIGLEVGLLTFICGYAGMWLQKLLPEAHMSSGARDMIGAVMGLIALLALALGTLVGSAYGFFATQKANVAVLAARSIHLDMAPSNRGRKRRRCAPAFRGRSIRPIRRSGSRITILALTTSGNLSACSRN